MYKSTIFMTLILSLVLLDCSTKQNDEVSPCDDPIWEEYDVDAWRNREYGIGVVDHSYYIYHPQDDYSINIYTQADSSSDLVAVYCLYDWTLDFVSGDSCLRSSRQIEWEYEISGFAILGFNADSSFVEVTLNPWTISNPPVGWISLADDNLDVRVWAEYLVDRTSLFFIQPDSIKFYSDSTANWTVDVELTEITGSRKYDYGMFPIRRVNDLMFVEVFTPNNYCATDTMDFSPDSVWIQYLNETSRPKVFYYSRGC